MDKIQQYRQQIIQDIFDSVIDDGGSFTFDKVREAIKILSKKCITTKDFDIHVAISPESESDLLGDIKLTSTDFPTDTIEGVEIYGITFHVKNHEDYGTSPHLCGKGE